MTTPPSTAVTALIAEVDGARCLRSAPALSHEPALARRAGRARVAVLSAARLTARRTARRAALVAALMASLAGGLLAGCSTAPVGAPSAVAATAPAEVRQALAPTGVLRVAVYPGSPTSLVRGPAGVPERGVTVELGRELARRLGVPVELKVFERVPQIIDALKAGQADMTLTNASPARAREVDFTPPLVLLETGYLAAPGSRISAVDQVDQAGVRVGVAQGSTSQATLGAQLRAARLVAAPSVPAATEQLRRGELDVFATNKGILFDMADRLPGSRVLDGRWGLEQLAIAVPQGRAAGRAWLQAFVADAPTQALVRDAAGRAGLRGLAEAGAR